MSDSDTPKGGCYHIWVVAEGGNAMFRWQRCYTATNAGAKINQWTRHGYGGGDRPGNLTGDRHQFLRLKCRPGCRCGCQRGQND